MEGPGRGEQGGLDSGQSCRGVMVNAEGGSTLAGRWG